MRNAEADSEVVRFDFSPLNVRQSIVPLDLQYLQSFICLFDLIQAIYGDRMSHTYRYLSFIPSYPATAVEPLLLISSISTHTPFVPITVSLRQHTTVTLQVLLPKRPNKVFQGDQA
jgi:hypothetical protein